MVGREGDGQFSRSKRGAIAGCHCSVLWLGGRVMTNFGGMDVMPLMPLQGAIVVCFGGVDVVPLQGAILVCYGRGGEGDDQLWGSGRSAIAGWWCALGGW